ncbi:MAG: hypothetical protein AAF206_10310 [Bacteroidota bacterium]
MTGTPVSMNSSPDPDFACLFDLENAAILLRIQTSARALCKPHDLMKPLRARGYVRDGQMTITHPLNVERPDET